MLSDMKRTLILSVIFGLASLAAAQTDSSTTQPQDTTQQQNTAQPATTAPAQTTTAPASNAAQGQGSQLSAEQYYARAQEQAAQAEIAYPTAFVDRTLWKAAVTDAALAAASAPDNRDYRAYEAQLYTKTQWWINAYNAWSELGELTDGERDLAALSAAKLGYLALQRGDSAAARTYVTQGMQWRNTQSLQDLMRRL